MLFGRRMLSLDRRFAAELCALLLLRALVLFARWLTRSAPNTRKDDTLVHIQRWCPKPIVQPHQVIKILSGVGSPFIFCAAQWLRVYDARRMKFGTVDDDKALIGEATCAVDDLESQTDSTYTCVCV